MEHAHCHSHPPPIVKGIRIKIKYITQIKKRPPTFALFINKPTDLPESYLRYLKNTLAHSFHLEKVPLRLILRKPDTLLRNKKYKKLKETVYRVFFFSYYKVKYVLNLRGYKYEF